VVGGRPFRVKRLQALRSSGGEGYAPPRSRARARALAPASTAQADATATPGQRYRYQLEVVALDARADGSVR